MAVNSLASCNNGSIRAQPELLWFLTPSTGFNVVNKINMLPKSLLKYQCFINGIESEKQYSFDSYVTTCKTTNKRQKEGHFTTSVPVDPILFIRLVRVYLIILRWPVLLADNFEFVVTGTEPSA